MNDAELLRYSRQILLSEVDVEGQEKLLASRALIVGMGGLGSPAALYLAAAGVGTLMLADFDHVEVSNLQRQILHREDRIGMSKVASALLTLAELNPSTKLIPIEEQLDVESLRSLLGSVDVVLDCTDNFGIRIALNEACAEARVPLISGAAIRLEGQITVYDFRREDSPCYRCLYRDLGDEQLSCSQNGVLAPLVGIIGSMQAAEAIKLLADFGESLAGRLQLLDLKTMNWRQLKLQRDPSCPYCSFRGA